MSFNSCSNARMHWFELFAREKTVSVRVFVYCSWRTA
jgi:hypothetical protein